MTIYQATEEDQVQQVYYIMLSMYLLNHIFLLFHNFRNKIILFQAKRQTKRSPGMKPWSKVR